MIAYVEGRLLEKGESSCVIVAQNGVGYEIFVPSPVLQNLPSRGEACFLYTSFVVREDAQELFGFSSWHERETFRMLITINRVGARTALSILSTYSPDDLRRIVAQEDMLALTKVSGIGKQTGQKIFLELQYKMKGDLANLSMGSFPTQSPSSSAYRDALTGLLNLGYEENHVAPLLKEILQEQEDLEVSEALRATLKALAQQNK